MIKITAAKNELENITNYIYLHHYLLEQNYDDNGNYDEIIKVFLKSDKYKNNDYSNFEKELEIANSWGLQNNLNIKQFNDYITVEYPDEIYGYDPYHKAYDYLDIIEDVKRIWKDTEIEGSIRTCICSVNGAELCYVYENNQFNKGIRCVACGKDVIKDNLYIELEDDDIGDRCLCSKACYDKYLSYGKPKSKIAKDVQKWEYDHGVSDYDQYLDDLKKIEEEKGND